MGTGKYGTGQLRLLLAMSILLIAGAAMAGVVVQHYEFDEPEVMISDGYSHVTITDCWSHGEPGMPILPIFGARILLAPGEVVTTVEVIPGEMIPLEGNHLIPAGQRQYPLSQTGPIQIDQPAPEVYESVNPYPGKWNDDHAVGMFRGYSIATVPLHPVVYRPADGTLSWMRNCELRITTSGDAETMAATVSKIRHDEITVNRVRGLIDNSRDLGVYGQISGAAPLSRALDPADDYDYLIITTSTWSMYLDEFVEFQTRRGLKAGVFLRDWIETEYPGGVDSAARIRDFIIDAYQTWGPEYVLLVGDTGTTQGIPHRGLYCDGYGTIDTGIPADLYYGCLDGNWNSDGDGYWGEPGEEDFYHEVGVGRACVSSVSDIQNWIVKQIRYQTEPVVGECDEALMVGELLWSEPTWGGDYKDEVKDGSSMHGYTTVGFPGTMNVDTLYDREGTWSYGTLINMMNNGLNIINHLGHCDYGYMMKFYTSNLPNFTNDGTNHSYNFIYSQGCNPGGFDTDCIGENFNCDEHGAVALVINARYGWGQHESTDGSSQYFDRQFFDAMFNEEIYALADANDDSKMDNVWSINYGANRWCYYELNLFGDPAMQLWTAEPGNLDVTLPGVIFIGVPEAEITVRTPLGAPVAGARVCIYNDDLTIFDSALTNAFGVATVHPNAAAPGVVQVTVVAHDFMEYGGEIPILPPEGPYLVFDTCDVLDPEGDNDGELDEGETVGVNICLENVGVDPTSGITTVITCDNPYITIDEDTRSYPEIPAGGFGTCVEPFVLSVAGEVPDGEMIQIMLTATSADGSWDGAFTLSAQAPALTAGSFNINDSQGGNGSGTADAGETFLVQFNLGNSGQSAAGEMSGVLSSASGDVVVLGASAMCAGVPLGGTAGIGYFEIQVLPLCPEPSSVEFQLQLTAANGYVAVVEYTIPIGGWFDDFELGQGWIVGASDDNASSGIWARLDPIGTSYDGQPIQPEDDHTADPSHLCFVTGNGSVGGSAGENDVDGGKTTLFSPIFHLEGATGADISYWRWYTNAHGNNPGEGTWAVDVTSDGVNWISLENTSVDANYWQQLSFDLTEYITLTDQVQIRFTASDDGGASLVEAAVDDFLMMSAFEILTAVDEQPLALPDRVALGTNFPNPFNPTTTLQFDLPRAAKVELAIFDVTGRRVTTLVDGLQTAGHHEVIWNGRDTGDRQVASGIYFSRLATESKVLTRKMLMLK